MPKDTSGKVRILMENVPDTDIVKSMVPEFNKDYPNVKVDIETLTYDQMRDKLVSSFQSSSPTYDLIIVDNPWMVDFANAKFLQPLDARIDSTPDYDASDFFPSLTEITTVDKVRYGVPFYNYALGYLYNTDDLAQARLEVPKTLDELVSTSKALKTGDRAGIAMQPQRGYKIFEEWGNWLFAAGGSIYDASGKLSLNTPQAKQALNAYIDTYRTAAPPEQPQLGLRRGVPVCFQRPGRIDDQLQLEPARSQRAGLGTVGRQVQVGHDPRRQAGSAAHGAGRFRRIPAPRTRRWAFTSWMTSKPHDVQRTEKGGAAIRQSTLQDPAVLNSALGADYLQDGRAVAGQRLAVEPGSQRRGDDPGRWHRTQRGGGRHQERRRRTGRRAGCRGENPGLTR